MTMSFVPRKNGAQIAIAGGIHRLHQSVATIAALGLLAGLAAASPVSLTSSGTPGVAPASQENRDAVQTKDGKTESGTIKSEDYAGLAINPTKGPPRTIEWAEIVPDGITYAGPGAPEFMSAKDSMAQGKIDEALKKFEDLKAETKLRPVLKQNVLYFLALVQQRKGDYDAALAGFKELATAFPKSRYLMDIGEHTVACYVAKKDVASASKALDELSAAATTAGVENGFGSAINVLKGRIFEKQDKFAEAAAAYGVAEKATGVLPIVVFQARLGEARCAVALNKKSDAEALLRKLVTEDAPNTILAGAWNGLGDLLKEEARKANNNKGDGEKLLDALLAYLRGCVQYGPLPGDSTDEYERALRGASDCFKFISEVETKPEAKKLYRDRSAERLEVLKREYPNSAFLPH
jgi:tetratricopeptide (TPR) repeat protein